ncbi:MAG TPA: hypothetical protein PL004_05655 [Bacillota bacterium]|nr:hypothetical protein [Bacillota bacterium]
MDGGLAALIPDESQPSAITINPEAAVMDAAAVIAMAKPYFSKSKDGRSCCRGPGSLTPRRWGFQRG